ncbi:MAG: cell division protein FtsA [Candidatus Omnitrophota bacterium]
MFKNYICAIDIGSSKISAVCAKVSGKRITELYFENTPSKGVRQGMVVNSIDLVSSLSKVLSALKRKSGIRIKYVYTNLSGSEVATKHSYAIMPLAERGNKVISPYDIQKVVEQARVLGSSLEEEIIHQMPASFSIDSKSNILNPIGLYSHRLEVDLYLIYGKLSAIQSLTRAVNQAGYEIKDLYFSGVATAACVFNKENRDGINVLCDIGSDITELVIFKDGLIKAAQILPIGGNFITQQLADELSIPFELAEDLKKSHASIGDYGNIPEDKEILIKKNNIYKPIKQRLVAQIVTAKAKEICEQVKAVLEKNISANDEVKNFSCCGRIVFVEGFLEAMENVLGISVRLSRINNPALTAFSNKAEELSGQKYLDYLTALGVICQALFDEQPHILSAGQPAKNPLKKFTNRLKEVYREYF